jgi:hypothetical protein
MEDLKLTPPPLAAVRELRWRIAGGHSMNEALRLYLDDATTEFAHDLREWRAHTAQGHAPAARARGFTTPWRRALLELIERGCNGQPTLEQLATLEEEMETAAQAELDAHLGTLPFKVLVPLLLFQFPAYLLLLLGPILRELAQKMGG